MRGDFLASNESRRLRLCDFANRLVTFSPDRANWQVINPASDAREILLLGLGPGGPWDWLGDEKGYWLENPDILSQTSAVAPSGMRQIDPAQLLDLASLCKIYFYRPNLRVAPEYWGSILAQVQWAASRRRPRPASMIWLPGNDRMLLHQELKEAFIQQGHTDINSALPKDNLTALDAAWNGCVPAFALSVNFRGLDSSGRIFELCRAAKVPLAVWIVDNPWHILSAISLPWWKEANLFVTDASFIAPLKSYGATHVWHLPLAASTHMFRPLQEPLSSPLFVGRSEFPGKDKFFAGVRLPPGLLDYSFKMLDERHLPDYGWWQEQLNAVLWPGLAGRPVGYGADICSFARRARWLTHAGAGDLRIIGDSGWKKLLPGQKILPPVDYYTQLPTLYGTALCNLNVTSLLLPGSLSQRHFDVWAAGGFLFTDNTPGLAIFPSDLVAPIRLRQPEEYLPRLEWLRGHPQRRAELSREWNELIKTEHTYVQRIKTMRRVISG